MKQIVAICLFIISSTLTVSSQVIGEIPESEVKAADVFILLDGDTYYLYGTRAGNPQKGFEAFSSKDLKTFKREGYVTMTGRSLYWAPEVYKFDGKYYMYYSANHRLYVATADSPLGPFKDVKTEPMLELGINTIDQTVFTDTLSDGSIQQWMFFVEENGGNRIYRCKLNSDHVTCDPTTVQKVLEADRTYEMKVGYKCTEGPIVLKKGSKYFLMYSANTYDNLNYCVCVAFTSDLETNMWTKQSPNPILNYSILGNQLYGTGHHGWFIDKDGQYRIVFHAYKTPECTGTRRVYIGSLNVSSTRVSMNTSEPIISPKLYMGGYDVCDSTATAVQAGTSVCADLNNDGYKDFIVAGNGRTSVGLQNSTLLFDPLSRKWNKVSNTLQTVHRPAIRPCDMNMDGNIDILTFDSLGISSPMTTTDESLAREGLFLGDGSGNFVRQPLSFVNEAGMPINFNMIAPESADVADFNNDGLPDIVLVGHRINVQNANVVLLNQGNFTFKVIPWDSSVELYDAVVQACDFNNDGYNDFIVSGAKDNGLTPYTVIYEGVPSAPGTFVQKLASGLGIRNLSNGTVQVADINNDGLLDLFIQGSSANVNSTSKFRQSVFINKSTSSAIRFVEDLESTATTSSNNDTPRIQNSTPTSAGIIDWDGDGWFDLIATGRNETFQTQLGFLYRNVNGHLMSDCVVSGGSSSTIAFPDWNGDGVKDYYNSGYSTDDLSFNSDFKGCRSTIYLNMAPVPQRPVAPSGLQANGKAGDVILSWTSDVQAMKNTTYEYFIKDAHGRLITQTLSNIGGVLDGIRKVNQLGNAGCNQTLKMNLPEGSYTWGVQAINAAYDGSVFTTGSFDVSQQSVTSIQSHQREGVRAVARYNLNGQVVGTHYTGLVITKYSDGVVRKEIVE